MSQADIEETETSQVLWPSPSDRVFVKAPPIFRRVGREPRR
jgi:hypothetical protein